MKPIDWCRAPRAGRDRLGHAVAARLHRLGVYRHHRTIHSFMHDKVVVP